VGFFLAEVSLGYLLANNLVLFESIIDNNFRNIMHGGQPHSWLVRPGHILSYHTPPPYRHHYTIPFYSQSILYGPHNYQLIAVLWIRIRKFWQNPNPYPKKKISDEDSDSDADTVVK
jgi:hypothetical protein